MDVPIPLLLEHSLVGGSHVFGTTEYHRMGVFGIFKENLE